MSLTYGSVCSGIEAASVAWEPLGWRAAFLSEIAPFPRAVLSHRFPGVPLHGDFTTIERGTYADVDLLVGGTPCQSFSVAGLRGGMEDARGVLALEYLRLARRLGPRWIVWENVPGALSANGGRDFGALLGGLAELGYGWAYRVLDAQHFGVPQRRPRLFVVGCAGGAWGRAAAVLLEPPGVRGPVGADRLGADGGAGAGASARSDDLVPVTVTPMSGQGARLVAIPADLATGVTENAGRITERGLRILRQPAHDVECDMDEDCWCGAAFDVSIRRPTAVEFERFQGFPDEWTGGVGGSDSDRYAAIGNSMAVPVMRWIGERIAALEAA